MTMLQWQTYERATRGVTLRLNSFISHFMEHIQIVKSLKGFPPMALPSKSIVLLLNC